MNKPVKTREKAAPKTPDARAMKNPRRAARIAAGYIDIRQVSKIMGLKVSTLQQIESSGGACYERALQLATLYNCRLEIFA